MRKSVSSTKRTTTRNSVNASPRSKVQQSNVYFCHEKNGMYMGGVNSFQKNGKGIIIHDNGVSAITSYYNDLKHGHNIYFSENCLISAEFCKNKCKEIVFRIPNYLLFIKYNRQQQPDGKCMLFNYATKSIVYANYRKGVMVDKNQEKQYAVINRVFDLNNIEFLIGRIHSKVLNYEIDKDQNIMSQKLGNKLSVGFHKRGLMNGLGFTYLIKGQGNNYNPDTLRRQDQFFLRPVERGYFAHSQLNGMGEKWFKNGNIYIGDFKGDIFEGNGVLKNTVKNNWVSAFFERGNMCDLFDYSHEGEMKKYSKIVEAMHQKKTNWINREIQLLESQFLMKEIQNIQQNNPTSQMKVLEMKKRQVLKKIQENFICDSPRDSPLMSSRNIQSYNEMEMETDSLIRQPNTSSYNGKGFLGQKHSSAYLREEGEQSPVESSRRTRKGQIYDINPNERAYSADIIKLKEIPLEKEEIKNSKKSIFKEKDQKSSDIRLSKSTFGRYPEGNPAEHFNLDSKRIIGKSRIFRYMNDSSQENPPKFHYS